MELRETIEGLKSKNEEAQAVIQGALNNPGSMRGLEINQTILLFFLCPSACVSASFLFFDIGLPCLPDLRIQRQNSCESISSLNSLTSMSSMGSLKDQDAKKKKKKSWVRMQPAYKAIFDSHNPFVWHHLILCSDSEIAA